MTQKYSLRNVLNKLILFGAIAFGVFGMALTVSADTTVCTSNCGTNTMSLNQTSVSMNPGQSSTIGITGANGLIYISSNSNIPIVSAGMSGSSVIVYGIATGTATVNLCQVGYNGCVGLFVYVYAPSTTSSGTGASSGITPSVSTSSAVIAQVTGVATPASTTPSYSFSSNVAGTISYNGDCASTTTTAIAGNNTVLFNALAAGEHNNCTLSVTDAANNVSNTLFIPVFTVGAVAGITTPAVTSGTTANIATPSNFKFNKQLKLGMIDSDITELQKRLTTEGVYSGPITGKFGAQTLAAVKTYQKAHGLQQLGLVGPGTRAALNK